MFHADIVEQDVVLDVEGGEAGGVEADGVILFGDEL
jgi:hypothetical protein